MNLSAIEHTLRNAGWREGRDVRELVTHWSAELAPEGFRLHAAAERVLLEFGGLRVGSSGTGRERATSRLVLDPSLALGEHDRLHEYFDELRGRDVFPLGEVDGGHAFLAMAEDGEVFLLMDAIYDAWPSFESALPALLLGLRGLRSQAV
jgi:hypothetical protein